MGMTHEEGVRHRTEIYAFSRDLKAKEIRTLAGQRCKDLLKKGKGKTPEQQEALRGEIMAVLMEAQAALDRLEKGKTRG